MTSSQENLQKQDKVNSLPTQAPIGEPQQNIVQSGIDLKTAFAGTIKEIKYYLIGILSSFYRLLGSFQLYYQKVGVEYRVDQHLPLIVGTLALSLIVLPGLILTYTDIMSNELYYYEFFGLTIYGTLQGLFILIGELILLIFMIWDTRSLWLGKSFSNKI